jgi:hypothetical protein
MVALMKKNALNSADMHTATFMFVLQLGQFFAARAEFVPEPICRYLSLLHDRVWLGDQCSCCACTPVLADITAAAFTHI